jgi:hypothetical protein
MSSEVIPPNKHGSQTREDAAACAGQHKKKVSTGSGSRLSIWPGKTRIAFLNENEPKSMQNHMTIKDAVPITDVSIDDKPTFSLAH